MGGLPPLFSDTPEMGGGFMELEYIICFMVVLLLLVISAKK